MEKLSILVSSCDRYQEWWAPWREAFKQRWPDCPYPYKIISNHHSGPDIITVGEDIGWNRILMTALDKIDSQYVLLTLENHLLSYRPEGLDRAIEILDADQSIGVLQASPCWPTEIGYPTWPVLGEYSRSHHPFKACSLTATPMWRMAFLRQIVKHVIDTIPETQDLGRQGAIEFEVEGTKYWTQNANNQYPWRVLGIDRDGAGGEGIYRFRNAASKA